MSLFPPHQVWPGNWTVEVFFGSGAAFGVGLDLGVIAFLVFFVGFGIGVFGAELN
jgi:hypothetical protein